MPYPYVSQLLLRLGLLTALLASAAACGSDKKSEPAYYLRGRALDGASGEPVAGAQLKLEIGDSTHTAHSSKDGSYTLGPITAGTPYRVLATAKGMDDFEFTGMSLPAFEGKDDHTLIGDVALFKSDMTAPGFKLVISSADTRVANDALKAHVRFDPIAAGTDPALAATLNEPAAAGVIGAFTAPFAGALPSDLHSTQAYFATADNGTVEVPEGALHWGTTYNVQVDAGAAFMPLTFMLTAVQDNDVQVALEPALSPATAQLPQDVQQYFTGRIYDGVTLSRLQNYSMRLEYFDRVLQATVDDSGRYVVGPLLPNADYTIAIEADGYRSFLSHNAKITASANTPKLVSFYYDAFLYPQDVTAPAMQMHFALQDNTQAPSGTARFEPRSGSSLFDSDAETPAGVARQVWSNDEDLQQRTVVRDFTDGMMDMPEGELVLGVQYDVTVYGVEHYAVLTGGSFRAGVDGDPSFVLQPLTPTAIAVVGVSSYGAELSPDGTVEIRFNQPIAAYPRSDTTATVRKLNDAFSIDSPDQNTDGMRNELVDVGTLSEPTPNYRGVSYEINGDRLLLHWDRSAGLSSVDDGDPIYAVQYGALDSIELYSGVLPDAPPVTLDSLLGSDTLDVQLVAR